MQQKIKNKVVSNILTKNSFFKKNSIIKQHIEIIIIDISDKHIINLIFFKWGKIETSIKKYKPKNIIKINKINKAIIANSSMKKNLTFKFSKYKDKLCNKKSKKITQENININVNSTYILFKFFINILVIITVSCIGS